MAPRLSLSLRTKFTVVRNGFLGWVVYADWVWLVEWTTRSLGPNLRADG